MKLRFGAVVLTVVVALAAGGIGIAAHDSLPPGVPYARPDDPIAIESIRISENPMRAGDSVTGTVITTANVAAVTAQAGTYRIILPKTAPGTFRVTMQAPHLWWWDWRGTVVVTAIRTDGAAIHQTIPVEVRW